MKFNRQNKCIVSEVKAVVTSVGMIFTGRGRRESFWNDGNVLHIDWMEVTQGYRAVKGLQALLKLCAVTVYKLYLNKVLFFKMYQTE